MQQDSTHQSIRHVVSGLANMPSLRRGAVVTLLGNGVFNASRVAVIALLAKFCGPAVLGEFNHGIALSAPIVIALALELRSVYIADSSNATPFGAYAVLRTIGMFIAAGVLLALCLPFAFSGGGALWIVLAGACLAKVLLHQADVYWGVYQKNERLDLLAINSAGRGLLMLAAFGVCLPVAFYTTPAAVHANTLAWAAAWATVAYVIGWAAILLFVERPYVLAQTSIDRSWTWPQVRALAIRAFPLAVAVGIVSIADNFPLLLIRAQERGREALGYYGAMLYVPMAAQFIIIQLGNAATNRLALTYQFDRPRFMRLSTMLVSGSIVLGIAAVLVAWLLGDEILRLLFSPEYTRHSTSFLIIVIAQAVLLPGAMLGFIVTQMRIFWGQVPLQLIVLGITVAACCLLIPRDPIRGAAIALLIRSIAHSTLYALIALKAARR